MAATETAATSEPLNSVEETEPEEQNPEQQVESTPSQTELISQALENAIQSGNDLTVKSTRIAVCHKIVEDLKVPYVNVSKLVKRALTRHAQAAGDRSGGDSIKRDIGGSRVNVRIPPQAAGEQKPEEQQPAQTGAAVTTPPAAPQKPNYRAVLEAAKDEEELKQTIEYKYLKLQIEMGSDFVEGLHKRIGCDPFELIKKDQFEQLKHATIVMAMKYNWQIDERIEKLMLMVGWGAFVIMPPLLKSGLLDGLLDRKNAKNEDKKSDKPLASNTAKV